MTIARWQDRTAGRFRYSPPTELALAGQQPAPPPTSTPDRPSQWVRDTFQFTPDPAQTAVLDTPARRVLLCCTRQWGKSTVTALMALYHAFNAPETLTLCVSPFLRQSRTFLQKAARFLRRAGVPYARDPRDPLSLLLPNGSALIGLPAREANIRGFDNVSFLILDEAAKIPDEVYAAIRPTRAISDGRLWILSTPAGQSGFFFREWHDPAADWARFTVKATACPRISPDFLATERRALGEHDFAQEYLCEFRPSEHQLIPRDLIDLAVVPGETFFDEQDDALLARSSIWQ
ncbi:terminase large subunit domain-containing protein [uncultured Paludibaculum sp.]|uniref:terminase large subunit domain-containing protein n=1 Tax=uncultured Paludibaculum sp. TaxID=1765020 RepID=UPI002AABB8B0|nr:terminase family protein [uncultured Paludibaculum sp.]